MKNILKFFWIKGRATRLEYWLTILICDLVQFLVYGLMCQFSFDEFEYAFEDAFLDSIFSGSPSAILGVLVLIMLVLIIIGWIAFCAMIRRFHDTDSSMAYIFMGLIPLVGGILVLIKLCTDSSPGWNAYGNSTKYPSHNPDPYRNFKINNNIASKCNRCGEIIPLGGRFCLRCGEPVSDSPAVQNDVKENVVEKGTIDTAPVITVEHKVVPSPKVVKEKKPVDKKKIILISSIAGGVLLVAGLTVLIVNLVKSNQQKKYEQMIIESERAIAEYEESLRLANPMLDHIQMIDVAGGTFMMGNNSSIADNDEKNIHTVTLSSFEISQTEITQYAFETVMGYNPSQKKGSNTEKYAVENCTWFEALKFCNKLSEMYNYECVYSVDGKTNPDTWGQTPSNVMFDSSADGFRLPTEAEWEFAASERNYRPNYIHSGSDSSNVVGFFDKELHPVAQKKPNNLGLYDMSGNVLEWCWDWYGKNYPITEQYNPTGNTSGEDRILRGGSYKTPDGKCSITFRSHEEPQVPHDFVGFRVARKSDTPATYTSEPASRNPITSSSSSIDGNEIVSGILNLVTDGTSSELNKNVEDALENLATQAILDLIF